MTERYATDSSGCCNNPIEVTNVGTAERILSIIGGIELTIVGLESRGLRGLAALGAGIGLIYRGAVGHCSVYDALGRNGAETSPSGSVAKGDQGRTRETTHVDRPVQPPATAAGT